MKKLARNVSTFLAPNGLDCAIVPAKGQHKYTLIWLHGLGDTYHGFSSMIPQFVPTVRIILVLILFRMSNVYFPMPQCVPLPSTMVTLCQHGTTFCRCKS